MEIIVILILIIVIIVLASSKNKIKKDYSFIKNSLINSQSEVDSLKTNLTDCNKKIESLISENEKLNEHNNALSMYQGLVDLDKKAVEILMNAQLGATSIMEQAKEEYFTSKEESKIIIQLANQTANNKIANAENALNQAIDESKRIIDLANEKAKEIAGDALLALQNSKEYEKSAQAMKNVIDGYGNKYIYPTFSLLDDLAEEFGHTDAGDKLKAARETTRLMINNGQAAQCDYVEENRKNTAIRFVVDAFNGKVDSILSKVKKDNYGTLEQKIKDSFQLVNYNGKAFRNAVITDVYLNSRLNELKWAVIAQELKCQEQEEQRQIKEQIREEEKARREFEKAMREAQKEEETLKKLIEKAQKEISHATEAQRAKYEQKLQELEDKLKEAEEKNQRALSMAQQTKSGNVYIISNIGSFGENVFKIGMTRRLEPMDRVKELGDASVPFEFDVHSMIFSEDAPSLERELHRKFVNHQMNKVNPRKEFFKVSLTDIKSEIDKMGIEAKWTLVAEALQYRETLAIEDAFTKDANKRIDWEKHQLELDEMVDELNEEQNLN